MRLILDDGTIVRVKVWYCKSCGCGNDGTRGNCEVCGMDRKGGR